MKTSSIALSKVFLDRTSDRSLIGTLNSVWFKSPGILRFGTAASLGNLVFFAMDSSLNDMAASISNKLPIVLLESKEALCFALAYLAQIVLQHFLNALLVYGLETIATKERYISTLASSYSA